MSNQEKVRRIEELTLKLLILQEQEKRAKAETKEYAEKRDKINEKLSNLHKQIFELRKNRDKVHQEVKELKKQREDIQKISAQKIQEFKGLKCEIEELKKKRPSKSLQKIQQEINNIEWRIQTTPLSLENEKQLVEKVKMLGNQLTIHRKIEQLNIKRLEFETEVKALQTKAKWYSEKISEMVERSQEFHKKMLEKIEETRKLKTDADNFHRFFLKTKEKAKLLRSEIEEISTEIKQLRMEIQAVEEKVRKENEKMLLENMEKQAREKLKRGEKLTWEEFKVLAEKGIA